MSTDLGTLLTSNAYSAAGYSASEAARLAIRSSQPTTPSLSNDHPLIAACGDMVPPVGFQYRDQDEGSIVASEFKTVSNLIIDSNPDIFLALGDQAQGVGDTTEFTDGYDQTYGRILDRTHPVPGNHEYMTTNAAPYYTYFGNRAGANGNGWYSFNFYNWRIYCLNSCSSSWVAPGSDQMNWLTADLAAHPGIPKICTWHHPRWTDGDTSISDDPAYDYLWQVLVADKTTQLTLHGHDHNYQRWDTVKPSTPGGNTTGKDGNGNSYPPTTDATWGITQFVVATSGCTHFDLIPARPGAAGSGPMGAAGNSGRSTYGIDQKFGCLFLRLGSATWDWLFKAVDGVTYDSGTRNIRLP